MGDGLQDLSSKPVGTAAAPSSHQTSAQVGHELLDASVSQRCCRMAGASTWRASHHDPIGMFLTKYSFEYLVSWEQPVVAAIESEMTSYTIHLLCSFTISLPLMQSPSPTHSLITPRSAKGKHPQEQPEHHSQLQSTGTWQLFSPMTPKRSSLVPMLDQTRALHTHMAELLLSPTAHRVCNSATATCTLCTRAQS